MNKKMNMLEEMLELDVGVLTADTVLEDLEEWDSMAKLSLVVLLEDEFGKKVKRSEVMQCKTVSDILQLME